MPLSYKKYLPTSEQEEWRWGGCIFLKCMNPNVNLIAQLEFGLSYNDVAFQHVIHYAT